MPLMKSRKKNRSTTRKVTDSVKGLPGRIREEPGKAAVAAAGIAAAAAAGFAATRMIRRNGAGSELHVRAANGSGWMLTRGDSDKPLERFEQKRQAIEAGREMAKREGPSTLLIHRMNGKVSRRHVYEATTG